MEDVLRLVLYFLSDDNDEQEEATKFFYANINNCELASKLVDIALNEELDVLSRQLALLTIKNFKIMIRHDDVMRLVVLLSHKDLYYNAGLLIGNLVDAGSLGVPIDADSEYADGVAVVIIQFARNNMQLNAQSLMFLIDYIVRYRNENICMDSIDVLNYVDPTTNELYRDSLAVIYEAETYGKLVEIQDGLLPSLEKVKNQMSDIIIKKMFELISVSPMPTIKLLEFFGKIMLLACGFDLSGYYTDKNGFVESLVLASAYSDQVLDTIYDDIDTYVKEYIEISTSNLRERIVTLINQMGMSDYALQYAYSIRDQCESYYENYYFLISRLYTPDDALEFPDTDDPLILSDYLRYCSMHSIMLDQNIIYQMITGDDPYISLFAIHYLPIDDKFKDLAIVAADKLMACAKSSSSVLNSYAYSEFVNLVLLRPNTFAESKYFVDAMIAGLLRALPFSDTADDIYFIFETIPATRYTQERIIDILLNMDCECNTVIDLIHCIITKLDTPNALTEWARIIPTFFEAAAKVKVNYKVLDILDFYTRIGYGAQMFGRYCDIVAGCSDKYLICGKISLPFNLITKSEFGANVIEALGLFQEKQPGDKDVELFMVTLSSLLVIAGFSYPSPEMLERIYDIFVYSDTQFTKVVLLESVLFYKSYGIANDMMLSSFIDFLSTIDDDSVRILPNYSDEQNPFFTNFPIKFEELEDRVQYAEHFVSEYGEIPEPYASAIRTAFDRLYQYQ